VIQLSRAAIMVTYWHSV